VILFRQESEYLSTFYILVPWHLVTGPKSLVVCLIILSEQQNREETRIRESILVAMRFKEKGSSQHIGRARIQLRAGSGLLTTVFYRTCFNADYTTNRIILACHHIRVNFTCEITIITSKYGTVMT
jgi:hypothetical protein